MSVYEFLKETEKDAGKTAASINLEELSTAFNAFDGIELFIDVLARCEGLDNETLQRVLRIMGVNIQSGKQAIMNIVPGAFDSPCLTDSGPNAPAGNSR